MSSASLPEVAPSSGGRARSRVRPPHTLLVVEDEPILRASMVRGLSKLDGIDVVSTGTVDEARVAIRTNPPDFVICDLDLPDGSGIEVVGELDRVGLRVPIAFVSAFVGQYRGRLPKRAGTDVFEKPVSLERLRRLVGERLDEEADVASSPFGVADYIQLAGMGRRSVVVDVRGRVAGRGEVVIRGGEVWSARDEQGDGLDAFRRLAFLADAVVTCRPLDHVEGSPRNVSGSCESVLLEAARRQDETSAQVDDGWDESDEVPTEKKPLPTSSDEMSAPPPTTLPRAFSGLYEQGVDALLAKRFDEAYRAFREAEAIAPGDTRVHANLSRLRQMGYGS
ncbi:MAG: response regulator [Deltaproteobacteria bacterium]|nr:response regulator [Deltaproteobacteria bacterium]